MANFAELDENNNVIRVVSINDKYESRGEEYCNSLFGGIWKQTSYNTINGVHLLGGTPFRGNYAGVGYTYDESLDAFIPPKPSVDLEDGSGIVDYEIDPTTYSWIPVYSEVS